MSLVTGDGAGFHYEGLDNVKRKTELHFWPPPSRLETNRATFDFRACAPQAWASAAPVAFLGACLGMELRHEANSVSFRDPAMPAFLDYLTLNQLNLGKARLDLRLHRHGRDVPFNLLSRQDGAKVMLVK